MAKAIFEPSFVRSTTPPHLSPKCRPVKNATAPRKVATEICSLGNVALVVSAWDSTVWRESLGKDNAPKRESEH